MTAIIIWGIALIWIANTIGAVITVFRQQRDIAATWAWLLVLIFLPIIGFVLYLFFGKKLPEDHMVDLKTQERLGIDALVTSQKAALRQAQKQHTLPPETQSLINLFLVSNTAVVTQENNVTILTDLKAAYQQLLTDVNRAQDHIHLEYYAFYDNEHGRQLVNLLAYKALRGVKVRVMYDAFGSQHLSRQFFKPLEAAGGQVVPFFSSRFRFVNLRFNFRNHRQLAVIDGNTAYLGDFNQNNHHVNIPARDTRIRITGDGVLSFQARFFMDWNAATRQEKVYYSPQYFPNSDEHGQTSMQLVSSGPDRELDEIKLGFLKMIAAAKKRLWIQTPYFIPDDSVLAALVLAINSGVTVKIMMAKRAKHKMIHHASLYYARQIVKAGGQIYFSESTGFKSRVMLVDEQLAAVGTANLDIRSFRLNFETTAFLYDAQLATELEQSFTADLKECLPFTKQRIQEQSNQERWSQDLARLFAPIM
ncbi:cardiolipin synthase [Latilactobacillus curvatus]|uniref:Cardiolipin synthase n=1 Tax=Latilactobacillus curvatus TaxID=28038 RepID=A0AAJ5RFS0_LATCU|nr:cardiolipin synthase [Latilactobacillus curvatus]WDC92047.1 cardiolipin synthase [Latilactobacillus curvatus]